MLRLISYSYGDEITNLFSVREACLGFSVRGNLDGDILKCVLALRKWWALADGSSN